MKKFLITFFSSVLYFSLFFLVINILFLGIIVATDNNFKKRLESLNFNNPDFELLVFGKSLAMDGIDTEYLTNNGIKSYNMALGGSSLRSNLIQLEEYLSKCQSKPEIVIMGLGSYTGLSDGTDIHPIIETTMNNHKFSINDIPLKKFQWLGVEFAKKVVSKKHREARLIYGQLKFQKMVPDYTEHGDAILNISSFERSHFLGEIAELCNTNGIKLMILEMPGFRNTQNIDEVGPYQIKFDNGLPGRLYNFNSRDFGEIFDPYKDWIGNSHLNEFGAHKFTQHLLRYLQD